MPEVIPVQLLIEPVPQSGSWNMAQDEVLLELADREATAFVRLYQWDAATVSLGYFQDAAEFQRGVRFAGLPVVRRLSGGGAILHHHELTYSCALPSMHSIAADPVTLYAIAHRAIVNCLRQRGVDAAMRGVDCSAAAEPFLCFLRGDRHDIVCRGQKIVGSAQRRRRGAVLQHGSLILKQSEHAPEIPGVRELTGINLIDEPSSHALHWNEFARSLGDSLAAALGPVRLIERWPAAWHDRVRELERERYSSVDRLRTHRSRR